MNQNLNTICPSLPRQADRIVRIGSKVSFDQLSNDRWLIMMLEGKMELFAVQIILFAELFAARI